MSSSVEFFGPCIFRPFNFQFVAKKWNLKIVVNFWFSSNFQFVAKNEHYKTARFVDFVDVTSRQIEKQFRPPFSICSDKMKV